MDFLSYINLIKEVGFCFYRNEDNIIKNSGLVANEYIKKATKDFKLSMPINKATYYTVLIKK